MFPSDIELNYLRNIEMPEIYIGHYTYTSMGCLKTAMFLLFYIH